MLGHDFQDMPSRTTKYVPDDEHPSMLLENVLRCRFCFRTPGNAREDGCPINELETAGSILLSDFNPDGVGYFNGRACVTCGEPIMSHRLLKGSADYWCPMNEGLRSEGVEGCVTETEGVAVPAEPETKDLGAG